MSSTPAPIFNHRKRPRQSLIADPQQNLGTLSAPGPAGAAMYNDLMPPGGFGNNRNQPQQRQPTSGQGAALYPRQNTYGNKPNQARQTTVDSFQNRKTTNTKQCYNSYSSQSQPAGQRNQNQTFNCQSNQSPSGNQQWSYQRSGYQQINRSNSNLQPATKMSASWPSIPNNIPNNSNKTGSRNTQSTWNKNVGNQSSTSQRYGSKMAPQSSPQNFRGEAGNVYNKQPNYGLSSKMVATSSSGHVNNKYTGITLFSGTNNYNNPNKPCSQRAMGQYKFRASQNQAVGGVIHNDYNMDEWDKPFEGNDPGSSVSSKKVAIPQKKPTSTNKYSKQDAGLRFLTVTVAGLKRWSKFKDSFTMLFELFGVLDSAITKSSTDCREFLIRDEERNTVKCVFYEIDRQIPKMTRGMVYRVVGTYDRARDVLKCSSVRSASDKERFMGVRLTALCTQAMSQETRDLREI